jgi:hypothetical protein
MKLKKIKVGSFLKKQLLKETDDGKKKIKPVAAGSIVVASAIILNALSSEFLGVSIPVEVFTEVINSIFSS